MKTDIKHLAAYAATAIWADGEYDEAEKIALEEIAEAYEFDYELLAKEVEAALEEIKDKSEEEIDEYLRTHSVEVEDEEAELIYMAALQIVLVDGVLALRRLATCSLSLLHLVWTTRWLSCFLPIWSRRSQSWLWSSKPAI
jgi:tellurite resistance protein